MPLLIVIPFTKETASQAEKLCDFIFWLSGKASSGHCLLVATDGVHEEWKLKTRLAAEVAFETVDLVDIKTDDGFLASIASIVAKRYKSPWLMLDPECVPLKCGWIERLNEFYQSQPKKYVGSHVKTGEVILLGRNSIYPINAIDDFNDKVDLVAASTKCRIIQQGKYTALEEIRPDSVLFCSDKTGELMKAIRNK